MYGRISPSPKKDEVEENNEYKPGCYGTYEYSPKSGICKGCRYNLGCAKVNFEVEHNGEKRKDNKSRKQELRA